MNPLTEVYYHNQIRRTGLSLKLKANISLSGPQECLWYKRLSLHLNHTIALCRV